MKKTAGLIVLLPVLFMASALADFGPTYFYGGDFDPDNPHADGLSNETDAIVGGYPYGAAVYQNFVVTGETVPVVSLFTNNLSQLMPSSAYWEIRTGISEGNRGTLVASGTGTGDRFSQTPTGRSFLGYSEYRDQVWIPLVYLPADTYWFAVVPNDPTTPGRSFNSNTFGLNAIGTQISDQQYWNSSFFGVNFTNANNQGVYPTFSSGVMDGWVPEPSSLILLGTGLLGAVVAAGRRWFI